MAYLKKDSIYIEDASNYTKKEIEELIEELKRENPSNDGLMSRSDKSYLNEWAVHALCFRWGIMKERAKNAKLQFDMEPEVRFLYDVIGPVARIFIK